MIGCINGSSGFGSWQSCDYYAVVGEGRTISGRVLTKHGKPLNAATITIDGPTAGTVRTNSNGDYYADQLDPGGSGIVWRARDTTTYVVPAGRYTTISVNGTGSGTAHIEVFGVVGAPLTTYAREIST